MAVTWEEIAFANKVGSKTSAAWSKTIGSGGDYATWAAMIADMPDLIAHEVTVTIKAGTTLTETCDLKNKHGLTSDANITIQAEKYFPTSGALPTADSGTATTLRDAALAVAALGDDYFNGCWIFVHHGTGTDNGPVLITDYIDATGDIVVASWPGTQPDATSRYLIVGALIDALGKSYGQQIEYCSVPVYTKGFGIKNATFSGLYATRCTKIQSVYMGFYNITYPGLYINACMFGEIEVCGIVNCNTGNGSSYSGVVILNTPYCYIANAGISDNLRRGVYTRNGSFALLSNNFGDGNGVWGSYAIHSAQVRHSGTECSGSSGNHSDPGTAGTANADQASAY